MPQPAIFITLGALVIIGVVVLIYLNEKKRSEALAQVARKLDLRFRKKDENKTHKQYAHMHLFGRGHGKRMFNIMSGTAQGIDVAIFDYRYTVGGGKNSRTYQQTVVHFHSAGLVLPMFAMRPEHILHKIGQKLGYQDINFDSYPEFSRRYLLQGDNENQIRMMFKAPLIRYLEKQDRLGIEGLGNDLFFYRVGKRVKPDEIADHMKTAFRVYGQLIKED